MTLAIRSLDDLIERLTVERTAEDEFTGQNCDVGSPRVFGGQLLGQALMAAGMTCRDRAVHSLHAVFLRSGDKSLPVTYRVRRQHDGAGFTRRHVTANQADRSLFECQISLQATEVGFDQQELMPRVPGPVGLRSETELRPEFQARLPVHLRERLPSLGPIDIRPVPAELLPPSSQAAPRSAWWLSTCDPLPDDPLLHAALLAYASDYQLLQAALVPHRLHFLEEGMQIASLDHALWFLRPLRMDDWLLFETESPSVCGGRALAQGRVFGIDGRLVAAVGQEGLLRAPMTPRQ